MDFVTACRAAGVTDWRFAWGSDGALTFNDDYPADQRAMVETAWAGQGQDELATAKATLLNVAAATRESARARGVLFGGVRLAAMPEDQGTMGDAITYLSWKPAGTTIPWKGKDGWIEVDLPTIRAAAEAVGDFIEALFAAEHAHHAAIAGLETVEAVQAYDVTAGWPA